MDFIVSVYIFGSSYHQIIASAVLSDLFQLNSAFCAYFDITGGFEVFNSSITALDNDVDISIERSFNSRLVNDAMIMFTENVRSMALTATCQVMRDFFQIYCDASKLPVVPLFGSLHNIF